MTFDRLSFDHRLRTSSLGRVVRHSAVVLSVDVTALQAARQHSAAHGTMIVADHEVAPKVRLGAPWTHRGVSAAFVIRPDLESRHEGRLWLAAALACARAVGGAVIWPDTIVAPSEGVARVTVTAVLAGTTIELGVVSMRRTADESGTLDWLADFATELERALDPDCEVASEVDSRLMHRGSSVRVRLIPRGEVVGKLLGVAASGGLRLEMGSGRIDELPVGRARDLVALRA